MRPTSSVLHLDLDAFFASVEQRDKPSLRGKPVVVGGIGQRGVVATASYEAREFGVQSAMPSHEARRRCPHAAFLAPRFGVYAEASRQVMTILRELSPLVEPLSLDEAFVDLEAATRPIELTLGGLRALVGDLKEQVAAATGGLRASVGIGSSKFIAKVATELGKPDGLYVVPPGDELDLLRPMSVSVIPGVGPVTAERLRRIGVRMVAELQQASLTEMSQVLGRSHAQALTDLAYARDDRPVEPERETKSISVEDTFETDLTDRARLDQIVDGDARQVARRLAAARIFARTVTIKVRLHDFTTHTRARTLTTPTDAAGEIAGVARTLLGTVDLTGGVRLLGVGVAGLTDVLQDRLFDDQPAASADVSDPDLDGREATPGAPAPPEEQRLGRPDRGWVPGADVRHDTYGDGWVWGAGLGRVTVRFETRDTTPGSVRTFAEDDPELRPASGPR